MTVTTRSLSWGWCGVGEGWLTAPFSSILPRSFSQSDENHFLNKSPDGDGTEKLTTLKKEIGRALCRDKPMAQALKSRKFRRAWESARE